MIITNKLYLDLRFEWNLLKALIRGELLRRTCNSIKRSKNSKGRLIVGKHVEIIALDNSSIELIGIGRLAPDATKLLSPKYPNDSFLGIESKYTFLAPPPDRRMKIFLRERSKLELSTNAAIMPGAYLSASGGATITIGTNSYLSYNVQANCRSGLLIGENCLIGQSVHIMDYDGHPILKNTDSSTNEKNLAGSSDKIKIGDNVWIGFRSIILKGVTIGDGSIVAAGSVVTSDIPAHCLAAGNPAKIIKQGIDWSWY
jgi:acetyltransferase-like isoleucine patch superfamily enzyme